MRQFWTLMAAMMVVATVTSARLTGETACTKSGALKALVVDGQNNHDWKSTSPVLVRILKDSGLFSVDVATSPAKGQDMSGFKPEFGKYDVVVLNYNGDNWPKVTQDSFVNYVKNGGGVVAVHAADNSFPAWKEYNEIIGIGGWYGRNEKSGPLVYCRDGKFVYDNSPGPGGSHGKLAAYPITVHHTDHPIMKGLPTRWMHAPDELYCKLRGPAKNMTLLASGFQSPSDRGLGRDEPTLFTIAYGQGRILHDTLGHDARSMSCVGFVVTLVRGAEWAATGKVTATKVPEDFPTATQVSMREELTRPEVVVDVDAIMTWDFTKERKSMAAMEEALKGATQKQMRRAEAELLTVLAASEATYAGKQYVCRVLRQIGSEQCVPVLAKLLTDAKLSHMARVALQHNACVEAGAALRAALAEVEDENLKIGMIGSLGARGERGSVSQIGSYLTSDNAVLSGAAIRALGHIGGKEAAAILATADVADSLRALQADSVLMCADSLLAAGERADAKAYYGKLTTAGTASMVRVAAYRGMIRTNPQDAATVIGTMVKDSDRKIQQAAGKFISEVPSGQAVTKRLAKMLTTTNAPGQIVLLAALAERGDGAAVSEVVPLAKSKEEAVRVEAVRALGVLGGADQVALLAALSTGDDVTANTAFASLGRLTGSDVPAALNRVVSSKSSAAQRKRVIEAIEARRETGSLSTLLQATKDSDGEVRLAAIKALGELGTQQELPALVEIMIASSVTGEQSVLQTALTNLVGRLAALGSDLEQAGEPIVSGLKRANSMGKVNLMPLLPRLGSAKALAALRGELGGSVDVKKAAVRALSEWPDTSPMADLLQLAKNETDMVNHVLALRGFIRLAGQSSNDKAAAQVASFGAAMDTARRVDEKRLVLAGLSNVRAKAALALAAGFLEESGLEADAATAVAKIALPANNQAKGLEGYDVAMALTIALRHLKDAKLVKAVEAYLEKIALPVDEGFTALFNGKDLSGWIGDTKGYAAQDGMIVCKPGGKLFTASEYSNFVFRFAFKLPANANNGLGIRTPTSGDPAYVGMELQILDNSGDKYTKLRPYQYHGSVYGVVPAERGYQRPVDQWNFQEVIADGDQIKITLNGHTILDANIREASAKGTMDRRAHPGLLNEKGHIGFLGHGSVVRFRGIQVKPLD